MSALRIINGFIQIKENRRILSEHGISSIINKLDLSTLQSFIEQATVDESFNLEKLQEIVSAIEEGSGLKEEVAVDSDIEQIVKMFQETKAAEAENPAAADEGLQKLNTMLTPEQSSEKAD